MHRIPRDLSGKDPCKLLERFGYAITRQTGSHIRLIAQQLTQEYHITIPNHDPLKLGTLNKILHDIAECLINIKRKTDAAIVGLRCRKQKR